MTKTNCMVISKSNLLSNIDVIKNAIGKAKLCAVVKANGYGVGSKIVSAIISHHVDYFAVANIDEAIELRENGIKNPILVLGYVPIDMLYLASDYNIEVSIISLKYFKQLAKIAKRKNLEILCQIKVNTGMNRFGIKNIKQLEEINKSIKENKNINLKGVYTHFATKSENQNFIDEQYKLFCSFTQNFEDAKLKHCASSYCSLNKKSTHLDMVRVGYNLYGMSENTNLKPVVEISSQIVNIIKLKKGESLGYGRSFVANRPTTIGVIPIGYADGFPRNLSNNFQLYCKGKLVDVIGTICMDVCFVDISGNKDIKLYDKVEIVGEHIKLINYAKVLKTSEYEILLNFSKLRAKKIINK